MIRWLKKIGVVALVLTVSACTSAISNPSPNSSEIQDQAQAFADKVQHTYGLAPAEVEAALAQAQFQAKIISLMNRPFEKQDWSVYQRHMLTPERIQQGRVFANRYHDFLMDAQQRTGVESKMVVAIIGVETFYGKNQGNYYVLDALATLSFGYPKRADFFQKELANYLVMCQENHWPVRQLKGSYAGAFGMGQFMPSSYREYALSAHQAAPDLSRQPDDAILSVANYFAKHGWKAGQPAAIAVQVPADLQTPRSPKLKKTQHDVAYWRHLGVKIPGNVTNQPAELVVQRDANGRTQAWLIFHNFYVIARYNPSLNYALSVFLLSEAV